MQNVHQVQRLEMDKEKIPLRVELLSLYYPELTNYETLLLARSMEIHPDITINEHKQIILIINTALSEKGSFYGESKEILNIIFANHMKKMSSSFTKN